VFKRGDVVLALFPSSNLQTAKTRPALVIQAALRRVNGRLSMGEIDDALRFTLGLEG
jgi:mRNA-degrading endonuclease toxin of MazEF toxin-antitoxin module